MRWSYSSARLFRQCQRKWFFAKVMAGSGKLKDKQRLRARRLTHLTTLSAWRGQIVDTVISEKIIPALAFDERVTLGEAKKFAKQLFYRQRAFAEAHREEDLSLVKSHHGDEFALFYEHAYGRELSEEDFEAASDDIVSALNGLYRLDDFRKQLAEGWEFVAQPPLNFDILANLKGRAFPDLIVFSDEAPIEIIDWKVHTDGVNDARSQLASYAIALSRMEKPNFNFPYEGWQAPAKEIVLKEVQLLLGVVREHSLTDADLEDAELFMMSTAFEMSQLLDGKKFDTCDIEDFETTTNPETCGTCAYRSICVEEPVYA